MANEKSSDYLNSECDTPSTNLVGGGKEEREYSIETLGKCSVNEEKSIEEIMGELEYVIKKTNRFNCPITLNPQDSTLLDVGIWAYYEKRLSLSTIEKRLRYARFMQNHKVPVDFKNPNYENFRKHMIYREEVEKASPNALVHEWKTMKMFLDAFGIPHWPYKPPYTPNHSIRILPFPNTVRKFLNFEYSKDPYENALYQYLFCHSFLIGWRVPSEICELKLDDVVFDGDIGYITITETKKHRTKRTLVLEKHIGTSKSHKSLKNWIDYWRPKVENQYSEDALYLWPTGKPVTVRKLGQKLSKHGKKVWSHFKPYDTRHWCAIARLIETKIQHGSYDTYIVRNWLGHTKIKTTENYIRYAEMYYKQFPKSWIHHALRSHKKEKIRRGKHDGLQCKDSPTNRPFLATLLRFSPVARYGPGRI